MKDWQEKKGKRWVGSYENETFDVIVLAKNAQGFFINVHMGFWFMKRGMFISQKILHVATTSFMPLRQSSGYWYKGYIANWGKNMISKDSRIIRIQIFFFSFLSHFGLISNLMTSGVWWICACQYCCEKKVLSWPPCRRIQRKMQTGKYFGPIVLWIYRCSIDRVIAVVMLFELVQSIPTVLGWRFNLERIRRRNVVAGASALSMVIVVFITDLLWSDISKSFHRNCSNNQNNILLKAVLGLGKKNVVEALPILGLKLDKRWPRDAILIVDYGELKHGSIVAKPQKCVFSDCASVHLAATLWKRVLLIVKKTPKMKEIETVEMCSFIHIWMALFNACLTTLMLAASGLSAQLHSVLSSLPGHWAMLVTLLFYQIEP